jgi:hypothetical protein
VACSAQIFTWKNLKLTAEHLGVVMKDAEGYLLLRGH